MRTPLVSLIDRELFRFDEIWAAAGHPNGVFAQSAGSCEPRPARRCRRALVMSSASTAAPRAQPLRATSAAWSRPAAGAKAACARSTRSPPGRRMNDEAKRACGECGASRDAATSAKASTAGHEAAHLLFDPISPFAYLAFDRLPQALEGISHAVDYRPVLFAGLLQHWGQKGPAEIEPKRAGPSALPGWRTQHGIALQLPAQHPFNPLPLLRLALACAPDGARLTATSSSRCFATSGAAAPTPTMRRVSRPDGQLAPPRDPRATR